VYAKNLDALKGMNISPICVNTGNSVRYFGEPRETPLGALPLYPKTATQSVYKPIKENEERTVKILQYR
jgi:hypothetical protein